MPRKPRTDPAQEALLQKKDKANSETSALIRLWIDLKRAWNGWPASDLGINERSDIKHPLPDQINQAQQQVKTLTDNILSQIDDIQKSQESYSRTRRLTRRELAQNPVSTAPETSAVDRGWSELDVPENAPGLKAAHKVASTAFSRLMAYILHPFDFKNKDRWQRLKMLRSSDSNKDLIEDIDNLVLSQKESAVPEALYKIKDLFYLINNDLIEKVSDELDAAIKAVEEQLPDTKERKEKETEPEKKKEKPVEIKEHPEKKNR